MKLIVLQRIWRNISSKWKKESKTSLFYQEVIRSEIRNNSVFSPRKRNHGEIEGDPLTMIQENVDEDNENFLFQHTDEQKKEILSPNKKSPLLLKNIKKAVSFDQNL